MRQDVTKKSAVLHPVVVTCTHGQHGRLLTKIEHRSWLAQYVVKPKECHTQRQSLQLGWLDHLLFDKGLRLVEGRRAAVQVHACVQLS